MARGLHATERETLATEAVYELKRYNPNITVRDMFLSRSHYRTETPASWIAINSSGSVTKWRTGRLIRLFYGVWIQKISTSDVG